MAAFGAIAVLRGVTQAAAMAAYDAGSPRLLAAAARLDPGSYRIRMRAASSLPGPRCDRIRTHAAAAASLFPNAPAPKRLLASCGARRRSR